MDGEMEQIKLLTILNQVSNLHREVPYLEKKGVGGRERNVAKKALPLFFLFYIISMNPILPCPTLFMGCFTAHFWS